MSGDKEGKHSRRRFIMTAGCAAATAAFGAGCGAIVKTTVLHVPDSINDYARNTTQEGPDPVPPTRVYPDMPLATVGVAGTAKSIETAVREAVEAAGGLREIEAGQKVVIKPNMVSPTPKTGDNRRLTTNPEVLRAVIRIVKERGASVTLGDNPTYDIEATYKSTGFQQLCKEEGATFQSWTPTEHVRFFPKKRHWSDGFRFPKLLAEADHFINVPILKNHEYTAAEFTCCLKSYVGVLYPKDRWQKGLNALHTKNIGEKIAEIHLAVKPTINIVDATTIMLRGGPAALTRKSVFADANLIIASKDRVACDTVALATLRYYGSMNKVDRSYVNKSVRDNVQIYSAAELGLGQAEPDKITIENISAQRLDEIKSLWN